MESPGQVDFVTKQSFLAGWFGEKRPLLGLEIANLYANTQRNALGSHLLTGFSQVVKSNKVRQYFKRGKEISSKHVQIFTSTLEKNNLPASMLSDEPITDSTVSPFSDKFAVSDSRTESDRYCLLWNKCINCIKARFSSSLSTSYGRNC
ncbi:Protein of unknown function [Lentibacillus halodurans]|uniref:Uncharacterized protein n=1 Tax=Lentibacillus halodurans TaxID=237679 RepID=A0A1I1AIV1_9BACI|nr:Protein of unknown function [Lentibacillus halodurans]